MITNKKRNRGMMYDISITELAFKYFFLELFGELFLQPTFLCFILLICPNKHPSQICRCKKWHEWK